MCVGGYAMGNSDVWEKLGPFGNGEIAVRGALMFSLVVPPPLFISLFKYSTLS